MVYDETYLAQEIIERCMDLETVHFCNETFEYDNADVVINGEVFQYFDYCRGDYLTPPTTKLTSRSADLHVELFMEDESRVLTFEETTSIEKMIENIFL